jgi:hypothetical protein
MRSFRSPGSDSNRSWAGGGGGDSVSRARSLSNPSWSGSGGGGQNWAKQSRNFSGGNLSGGSSSSQSSDAARQYRAFRAQSGDGSGSSFSGGGDAARRGRGNDQLQQMFKDYKQQQSAGGGSNTYNSPRGRNWSNGNNKGVDQTAFNQLPGANGNGNKGPGRGSWNRPGGSDNNQPAAANGDALSRFRNGGGNLDAKNWSGRNGESGKLADNVQMRRWRGSDGAGSNGPGQFGNSSKGFNGNRPGSAGGAQFAEWSKKDGGKLNPKTARWYGNSGFGDHRGRGDGDGNFNGGDGNFKGDGKWAGGNWNGGKGHGGDWNGGKGDGHHGDGKWNDDGKWNGGDKWNGRDKWGDHVRNDWNNNWWNKHGHGDNHGNWNGHGNNWWRGNWWNYDAPFCYDWWGGRRNSAWCYFGNRGWRDNPWYWWGGCSAPLLTTWVDFGWNYPCYWDYGPNEYITYYNNAVYVDGQRYATELEYYSQVRNLARSVPALTQDQLAGLEWLPLGVFAVTRPGQAQANELMQLAVSKDGILSGTLLDQRTGQSRPLQGMVEQATQKAAWTFADSPTDALVLETSLYNLTEPQCTALAHLDAVSTEVWQLTRLQQPQQQVAAPGQAPAAAPAPQVNAPAPAPAAKPVLPPQGPMQ